MIRVRFDESLEFKWLHNGVELSSQWRLYVQINLDIETKKCKTDSHRYILYFIDI